MLWQQKAATPEARQNQAAVILKDTFFTAIIAFAILGPIVGLKAEAPQGGLVLRERWGLEAQVHGPELRLEVPRGDEFVPELVRGITPRVGAIGIHRPTLDDVFVKLTGRAIREQESSDLDVMRQFGRAWGGRR